MFSSSSVIAFFSLPWGCGVPLPDDKKNWQFLSICSNCIPTCKNWSRQLTPWNRNLVCLCVCVCLFVCLLHAWLPSLRFIVRNGWSVYSCSAAGCACSRLPRSQCRDACLFSRPQPHRPAPLALRGAHFAAYFTAYPSRFCPPLGRFFPFHLPLPLPVPWSKPGGGGGFG